MKSFDIARRSGRSLRAAKLRTILTALAIAVGGFTLVLTLAASNGLRNYTDKLISSNYDPAELFVGRDPEVSNNGTPSDTPKEYDESVSSLDIGGGASGSLQIKRVTADDVEELKKLEYVENVRESYQINVRYVTRDGQKKYTASAEAYNPAQKPEIKAGDLPETGDISQGKVLLPDNYLSVLGFNSPDEAIGQQIRITVQRPFSVSTLQQLLSTNQSLDSIDPNDVKPEEKTYSFEVVGVTKKPATSLSFGVSPILLSQTDAKSLYDITTQGTADYEKYLFVYVRVKDGTQQANIDSAKSDLIAKGYYVQSTKDVQQAINQFVNILTIMVGVFGLITIIASVFGIINTQYISVLERTREIGLMKALGMRRKDINKLFIFEAAWIGLMGGIIGSIIGILLGIGLNPLITKQLELGEGESLLVFKPVQVLLLILFLMLVATLAGLLPARKASKLDPITALRTE